MVFPGLFPTSESGFEELQYAMSRFLLKDGSVRVEPEHSASLGRGLRCGFLGMLHMEVVQRRLEPQHPHPTNDSLDGALDRPHGGCPDDSVGGSVDGCLRGSSESNARRH